MLFCDANIFPFEFCVANVFLLCFVSVTDEFANLGISFRFLNFGSVALVSEACIGGVEVVVVACMGEADVAGVLMTVVGLCTTCFALVGPVCMVGASVAAGAMDIGLATLGGGWGGGVDGAFS